MCPLLTTAPDGRRVCSVGSGEVRPFWGRAAGLLLGAASVLFLAAVLSVFAVFRTVGYRVPLWVVAWPPQWHRVQQARADYYFRLALDAYRSGDARQSYLALSKVYALDPDNVDASRLLAQFTQIANPEFSDGIYWRLISTGRGDRDETAKAWYRALLARGDFQKASHLSLAMLGRNSADAPAWTQGLLFGAEMGLGDADIDSALARSGALPEEARAVLELSRSLRGASRESTAARVGVYMGNAATPFETYYGLSRLIRAGRPLDAVNVLGGRVAGILGAYEGEAIKLDAYSALGWHDLEESEIALLLARGPSPAPVILVSAHLIRFPSKSSSAAFFSALSARPLADSPANIGAHMAALCAAGANGLEAPMKAEMRSLSVIVGGSFSSASRVTDFFASRDPSRSPATFLPALVELPLEVQYAMFERYPPAASREGREGGAGG
jgi:hypothetical protein